MCRMWHHPLNNMHAACRNLCATQQKCHKMIGAAAGLLPSPVQQLLGNCHPLPPYPQPTNAVHTPHSHPVPCMPAPTHWPQNLPYVLHTYTHPFSKQLVVSTAVCRWVHCTALPAWGAMQQPSPPCQHVRELARVGQLTESLKMNLDCIPPLMRAVRSDLEAPASRTQLSILQAKAVGARLAAGAHAALVHDA